MRDFAGRLITHEAGGKPSSAKVISAAFHIPEKLRPHLTTLMGNAGYRALLMRSLALAGTEIAWLRIAEVAEDGSLQAVDPADAKVSSDEQREGGEVLVAQMIGLLVAFIGEKLTLQLVREVWPKLADNHLHFSIGDIENEKTKRRR